MTSAKIKRPREEVLPIAEDLLRRVVGSCHRIEIAGSLRRLKRDVGDIEVVAIPRFDSRKVAGAQADIFTGTAPVEEVKINALWEAVTALGVTYTKEGDLYRQFEWRGIQVDLFTAGARNWGWALLVRTGSWQFSKHMAQRLNAFGMTSKNFSVHRRDRLGEAVGEPIATESERDVFILAHEPWREPQERSWE